MTGLKAASFASLRYRSASNTPEYPFAFPSASRSAAVWKRRMQRSYNNGSEICRLWSWNGGVGEYLLIQDQEMKSRRGGDRGIVFDGF